MSRPAGHLTERSKLTKYIVYDNRTDFPVIVDGTARECAAAMGISLMSFRRTYLRCCHSKSKKWHIEKSDELGGTE